ncbi:MULTISPECIES: hypothetical protein [unclassified Bradyrhizobium]
MLRGRIRSAIGQRGEDEIAVVRFPSCSGFWTRGDEVEAMPDVRPQKKMDCALAMIAGGRSMKQVCELLKVARSNLAAKLAERADWQDRRSVLKY